jgi:hypothetical protein
MSAILVGMSPVSPSDRFELSIDHDARQWLDDRSQVTRLWITYMSSRACCSGARVCDVRVRVDATLSRRDARGASWVDLGALNGREVLIDSRLVGRMPAQLRFVQRGAGPFRHLDLDLSSEQWAAALYPVAH